MWQPHPDVLVTDLGDELVLMHAGTAEMFGLNESGRLAWLALPASADEVAGVLQRHYGLERAAAQADAASLLRDLAAQKMVQPG